MGELLEANVAVITGAARGIGRAIALAYAGEGAAVVVADVDGGTLFLASHLSDYMTGAMLDVNGGSLMI